jgi:hypothetical protein
MKREAVEQGVPAGSRAGRVSRLAIVIATAVGLAGCASMSEKIAGTASELPVIGLPAGAPERPAEQFAYPAVHDMPPPRSATLLSEVEQQKMEGDLVAARDAQQRAAGTSAAAQKKPTRQSPRVVPVASSRTIY